MKSKFFLTAALPLMAAALTLVFTGCSGDDDFVPESREGQSLDKGYTIFSTRTPETRTVVGRIPTDKDGNVTGPLPFLWTNRDYIWVQDDDGVWQKSDTLAIPYYSLGWPTADFKVPGKFSPDKPHKVRYTGHAEHNVGFYGGYISSGWMPEGPVSPIIYNHGDIGTDTAKWENGHYTFRLKHKTAFLCILPYATNQTARDIYRLKEVNVQAYNPGDYISGHVQFDENDDLQIRSKEFAEQKIILFPNGHYLNGRNEGVWVRTSKPDPKCCAMIVPILPGKHTLQMEYLQSFYLYKPNGTDDSYYCWTYYNIGEVDLKAGEVYTIKNNLNEPEKKIKDKILDFNY